MITISGCSCYIYSESGLVNLIKIDHNNRMITLSVITLSGFHCTRIYKQFLTFYLCSSFVIIMLLFLVSFTFCFKYQFTHSQFPSSHFRSFWLVCLSVFLSFCLLSLDNSGLQFHRPILFLFGYSVFLDFKSQIDALVLQLYLGHHIFFPFCSFVFLYFYLIHQSFIVPQIVHHPIFFLFVLLYF